jgi:hypothetical protein
MRCRDRRDSRDRSKTWQRRAGDRAVMENTYAKTRRLMEAFSDKHGSYICRQLLNSCDLTSEEGQKFFKENELLKNTCKPCVETVVDIFEGIL